MLQSPSRNCQEAGRGGILFKSCDADERRRGFWPDATPYKCVIIDSNWPLSGRFCGSKASFLFHGRFHSRKTILPLRWQGTPVGWGYNRARPAGLSALALHSAWLRLCALQVRADAAERTEWSRKLAREKRVVDVQGAVPDRPFARLEHQQASSVGAWFD